MIARIALAGVLAGSAVAKLAAPGSSRAALATFSVADPRVQTLVWGALVAAELTLAAGVAGGSAAAAYLAAGMLLLFALALVGAILRGRAGAPCACFGARSRVGWRGIARNLALAAALAALPLLPEPALSTDEWLGLGLGVALALSLGLAVAVFALAREVGMLRLRLGPGAALEIPEEGPPLGEHLDDAALPGLGRADLRLAVFTSEGCHVCDGLQPAIRSLAGEAGLEVAGYDEHREAAVWRALDVPGSPFAVALDAEGTVLAKGTFNNLAQLESILAAAERRGRGGVPGDESGRQIFDSVAHG